MPDLPLFLNVDGVYAGKHLAQPWGDALAEGVIPAAGIDPLKVGPVTPAAMAVEVAVGAAWVTNDAADDLAAYLDGGAWRVVQRSAVQVPVEAADPTNPRIDRLVLEVLDTQFGAASNLGRFRVVKGTPAASPSAPAQPRSAITLATVAVAAGSTTVAAGAITDARPTAKMGGRAAGAGGQFCQVIRTGKATVTDSASAWSPIAMTAEESDPFGMHTGSDPQIVLPAAGQWLLTANCDWEAPTATSGRLGIRFATVPSSLNFGAQKMFISGAGGGIMPMATAAVITAAAGLAVAVEVNQSAQGGTYGASAFRFNATRVA